MDTLHRRRSAAGQAMIELVIALIAVLALAAGILQLASLTTADLHVLGEARAEAGQLAMRDPAPLASPEYIRDWNAGNDQRRHSRDDRFSSGNVAGFNDLIVSRMAATPAQRSVLEDAPDTTLPDLRGDFAPALRFGLVSGHASTNVPLMSAVQSFLYRADSIDVEAEVWMTSTRGIY